MIVGIDLGTTNSLVAAWTAKGPKLIPNVLGDVLTPSCVSVDGDGSILVGRAARDRMQSHPEQSAALFKRHMGSGKLTRLGQRDFRPEELSALMLRALREDAEANLGTAVTGAIITVPAYFSDAQRKATRTAGQLAGLDVLGLLNEPTAAALAYGIHLRGKNAKFLVFDLGGGTFDVSILDLFEDVMEVRASAGDNFLGGEDFVKMLVDHFVATQAIPDVLAKDPRFGQRLIAQAEAAKKALSFASTTEMLVSAAGIEYRMVIDESTMDRLAAPLLGRLRDPVERAMRDARLRPEELDSVVLAGGATRMPSVRRLVARLFGRLPSCDINPDEVVALGAAVQAGLHANDQALREVVMTDVSPYSLGISMAMRLVDGTYSHGHFDPIIERNRAVPISRVKRYFPIQEGTTTLTLEVFQGESRLAADNIFLGKLVLEFPLARIEECGFDVRFTYDVNGLLEVEATVLKTQKVMTLHISDRPGALDDAEVAKRFKALSALKIHPRERMENRTLLARADRLYQQLHGAQRALLAMQIVSFEALLDTQDMAVVEPGRQAFSLLLDQTEQHSRVFPMDDSAD